LAAAVLTAAGLSGCGGSTEPHAAASAAVGDPQKACEPGIDASLEIAFARYEGTKGNLAPDIFLMNADGSGKLRLTSGPDADNSPAFSPDGERIAFSREAAEGIDTGGSQIRAIGVDGCGMETLTRGRRGVLDRDPAWSPDGERIAFTRTRVRFKPEEEAFSTLSQGVYVMDADGTGVTRLTERRDGYPVWSPDGERIAFTRDFGTIWAMGSDGDGEVELTGGPAFQGVEAISPSFSPDGERIAFLGGRQRAATRIVWVMNADGSDPAPLENRPRTGLNPSAPAWSPDGGRIAFISERKGPGVHVMNSDGTDQHRLRGGQVNDTEPAWSPAANGKP
jgi:Tol biopolymer transport system component